jgi:hypothetical protein
MGRLRAWDFHVRRGDCVQELAAFKSASAKAQDRRGLGEHLHRGMNQATAMMSPHRSVSRSAPICAKGAPSR